MKRVRIQILQRCLQKLNFDKVAIEESVALYENFHILKCDEYFVY